MTKIIEVKMTRELARKILKEDFGVMIQVGEKFYRVKKATLEELEKEFGDFMIYHCGFYWPVEDQERI